MAVTVKELISKMEWAASQGLRELTYTSGRTRVAISRSGRRPAATPAPKSSPAAPPSPAEDGIAAPLSGNCHLAPEPGAEPFISAGTSVSEGQTLCIIEAMKVMTPVPAPHAGTVAEILVSDGAPVEAGTLLVSLT